MNDKDATIEPVDALADLFDIEEEHAELFTATVNFAVAAGRYHSSVHPNMRKLFLEGKLKQ